MDGPGAPRISVLINTYNYARFLGRAIESALQQEYTGPPLEILVVDDGSTDDTAGVVRAYGDLVRYIPKDNGGQASALNVGIRQARGDILCLMDGDDYFYPGKVQSVADAFHHRPQVGLVYNEFDIVDAAGVPIEKVRPRPTWTGCKVPLARVAAQLRSLILLGHPWTCITSAISVRRSVVTDLPVPEEMFPHSPDLFLGLVLPFMTEVAIVERAGTAYVYHGDNVGLFRSSAANRALYARQLDFIRGFVEERFAVRFLRYGGRSIYGPGSAAPAGMNRLAEYVWECRSIMAAGVEPGIKRRSQVKLAAASLLPDALYTVLRDLNARHHNRQVRRLRRMRPRVSGREAPGREVSP